MVLCPRCAVRRVQDTSTGLCRRCGRETGTYVRRTLEAEAETLRRRQARIALLRRPPVEEQQPRPRRTVTIGGVEYEVAWDGT